MHLAPQLTTILTRHNNTTEPHHDDRGGGEMLSNSKRVWSNVNTLHSGVHKVDFNY